MFFVVFGGGGMGGGAGGHGDGGGKRGHDARCGSSCSDAVHRKGLILDSSN